LTIYAAELLSNHLKSLI